MNGIEKITGRIKADAQREVSALIEETKAKCEELRAEYKKQAETTYWELTSAGKKEAEQRIERRGETAKAASQERMLQLRQEMVAEAFARAEKKLSKLPAAEYEAFLTDQAVRSAVGGEKLIFSPADRKKYGAKVVEAANEQLTSAGRPAGLSLADETRGIGGGLILSGGGTETDRSVKALVELHANELAAEVTSLLFD